MSTAIIRQLFEARLASFAQSRNRKVAWENSDLTPEPNLYLQPFLLPGNIDSLDLAGDHRVYTGIFQVNVIKPKGGGLKDAQDEAEALVAYFPLNQELSRDTFAVKQVTPASIGPAQSNDTHVSVPVSFAYRADTI